MLFRSSWMPKAITYDEQPLTMKASLTQRTRWSSGAMQLLSIYFKKITQHLRFSNLFQLIDGLMSLMAVYIQLLSAIQLILVTLISISLKDKSLLIASMPLLISYLTFSLIAVLVLILEKKYTKQSLVGVLGFWLFVMSWSFVNLRCLFIKTTHWVEIKHTRSVSANKLKASRQEL